MFRSTAGIRSKDHPTECVSSRSSMTSMCFATPSTSATVNSFTGGSLSATRSASVPPTGSPLTSDSNSTSSARLRALLRADMFCCQLSSDPAGSGGDAAEVVTRAGVDLDLLTGGQEQRDLDGVAGLELGRLGATGGPVALQAGLGVLDLELDRGRELDVQREVVVHRDDRVLVLQQEMRGVADHLGLDLDLVVGRLVHEHVGRAVVVQVGHVALVDRGHLDLDVGVEGLVDHLARQHVLQLGP